MNREEFELMALRRVSEGAITIQDGGYVHHGRPVTGELAPRWCGCGRPGG